MPTNNKSSKNLQDEIQELKRKINLIDGDRKAHKENSEWTIKENQEKISKLRKEVKVLQKKKADRLSADEHVITRGLEDCPAEKKSLKDKPGKVAIDKMDEKIGDRVNILNNLRYKTKQKEKKLNALQQQEEALKRQADQENDNMDSAENQQMRSLENRLDKAQLKCKEAGHIKKTYEQIRAKLQDEHKMFETTLDSRQKEILRCKQELEQLKQMNHQAQLARDEAKKQLEKQEEQIYLDRRRREIELSKVRREVEEAKHQHEKIDNRIARGSSIDEDEVDAQSDRESDLDKIEKYEEAFAMIKEATGVSDTMLVVERFEKQYDTRKQLEDQKLKYEDEIEKLRENKEKLKSDYAHLKYNGESEISVSQKRIEEFENEVFEEERQRNEAEQKLERSSKVLNSVRLGIEHLTEKLRHVHLADDEKPSAKQSQNEKSLENLSIVEKKLMKLIDDMEGQELEQVQKQMDEEDFQKTVERKLPTYNVRINLPDVHRDHLFDDEDVSGDDENILTRELLKNNTKQFLDSKNKRKTRAIKKPKRK